MSTFLLLALENQGWRSISRGMGRAAGSFVSLRRTLSTRERVKKKGETYERAIKCFIVSLQGTSRSGSSSSFGGCNVILGFVGVTQAFDLVLTLTSLVVMCMMRSTGAR